MKQFRTFIDRRLYRIRGFMHPSDAMAFAAIMTFQAERGWQGAHAEIGIFYGRSLALMAFDAAQRASRVLGIDLFDIPGQQAYVDRRMGELGLAGQVTLHAGSSLEPAAVQALETIGPVRLFSVDGGHELVHIANDAELATSVLSARGVIAFDDFMNAQYPDLSRGILSFLESNSDRIVPFAITRAKLYCCPPQVYDDYFSALSRADIWGGAWSEQFHFLERRVVFINQPLLGRALYQTLAERGLGRAGDWLTRRPRRRVVR
jgi:hypothetical protein